MGFSSCSSEEIKFISPAKKSVKNPFQTTMMPPNWYQLSSNDRPPYTYPNFRSLTSFSKDFDTVKFPSNWEEICLNGQPDKMEFCDIYNRYFIDWPANRTIAIFINKKANFPVINTFLRPGFPLENK